MSCNTYNLAGIAIDCDNIGGVSAIYVADVADVTGVTIGTGDTVTAIAMESAKKFKQYAFRRGNASATSTGSRDDKAGTSYFTTEVNMTFNRQDSLKRKELNELFKKQVYVIIKHNTGQFQLIGYDLSVGGYSAATTLTSATGAEMAEANNYNLVLSAMTSQLPNHVDAAAVTAVI
jgi:hypothetical protein